MSLQNPALIKFVKTCLSSSALNIAQIIQYKVPGIGPKLNEIMMEFHTNDLVTENSGILIACRHSFQKLINPDKSLLKLCGSDPKVKKGFMIVLNSYLCQVPEFDSRFQV